MLYAVTCTCELTGRRGGDFEFVLSEVVQLEAGEERCREFPLGSVARCGDGVDSRLSGQEPGARGAAAPKTGAYRFQGIDSKTFYCFYV